MSGSTSGSTTSKTTTTTTKPADPAVTDATVTSENVQPTPAPEQVNPVHGGYTAAGVQDVLAQQEGEVNVTPGKVEPQPVPEKAKTTATPFPDDLYDSDAAKCLYRGRDDITRSARQGPIPFNDQNTGAIYHDCKDLNTVYRWTAGQQIPAGVWVVPDNALVSRAERRQILGKDDVG